MLVCLCSQPVALGEECERGISQPADVTGCHRTSRSALPIAVCTANSQYRFTVCHQGAADASSCKCHTVMCTFMTKLHVLSGCTEPFCHLVTACYFPSNCPRLFIASTVHLIGWQRHCVFDMSVCMCVCTEPFCHLVTACYFPTNCPRLFIASTIHLMGWQRHCVFDMFVCMCVCAVWDRL